METKHSILSASSAHRWLECTPSARAELNEGEECSVYAQEGTAAHALADIKLQGRFGKISVSETEEQLEEFKQDPRYAPYYNEEFEEFVDDFVEYIVRQTDDIGDYHIYFEFRVDFSHIVPQGFGTADVIIVTNDTVSVFDLKFGKGVPVSAQNNPQLRLYGVGAANLFPLAKNVKMHIYQPRLLSVDVEVMTRVQLIDWAMNYVKPRAELAIKGEGTFKASEDTCRWCKLRHKCRVRADKNLEVARQEFSAASTDGPPVPQVMTPEQIANVLEIGPMFADWLKDVQAYALGQLIAGVKIPGYKLVEGRSVRIMTDPDKIAEILKKVGVKDEELYKPREMLGITALEKLVGKKLFAQLCADYLIKPQGKLTMAPDGDRRMEVNSAANDFAVSIE